MKRRNIFFIMRRKGKKQKQKQNYKLILYFNCGMCMFLGITIKQQLQHCIAFFIFIECIKLFVLFFFLFSQTEFSLNRIIFAVQSSMLVVRLGVCGKVYSVNEHIIFNCYFFFLIEPFRARFGCFGFVGTLAPRH